MTASRDTDAERLDRIEVMLADIIDRLSRPAASPITLTVDQAARRYGCSADTIRALISQGQLRKVGPIRGRVLLSVREADALFLQPAVKHRHSRGWTATQRNGKQ